MISAPALAADDPALGWSIEDGDLTLTLGEASWRIVSWVFGDKARFEIDDRTQDRLTIRIVAGKTPASVAFPFNIILDRRFGSLGRRWHLSCSYPILSGKRTSSVLLSTFLELPRGPAGRFLLDPTAPQIAPLPTLLLNRGEVESLLKVFFDEAPIQAVAGGRLAFEPDLSWRVVAATSPCFRIELPSVKAAATSIRFGRTEKNQGPSRDSDFRVDASLPREGHNYAAVFDGVQLNNRTISLGRTNAERARLNLDSASFSIGYERWPRNLKKPGDRRHEAFLLRAHPVKGKEAKRPTFEPVGRLSFARTEIELASGDIRWRRGGPPADNSAPWRISTAFQLPAHPFSLRTGAGVLEVSGGPDLAPLELTDNGTGLKVGGEVAVTYVPRRVMGTDFSRLDLKGTVVNLRVADDSRTDRSFVEIGPRASTGRISLDDATLRIRRSEDLVALTCRFRNLDLLIKGKSATIQLARSEVPDSIENFLLIELPPQHVAEEVFYRMTGGGEENPRSCGISETVLPNVFIDEHKVWADVFREKPELANHNENPIKKAAFEKYVAKRIEEEKSKRDPDYAAFLAEYRSRAGKEDDGIHDRALALRVLSDLQGKLGGDDRLRLLARARLAGPTRLVFRIPKAKGIQEGGIPFTLDAITDVSRFELSVVRRATAYRPPAEETDTSVEAELAHFGVEKLENVEKSDRWDRRMKDIRTRMNPPGDFETAIELPSRLILSPSNLARWRTSHGGRAGFKGVGAEVRIPLWRIELDRPDRGNAEVRAVWSPDFSSDVFGLGKKPPDAGRGKDFRTAMDAYDRHELVALSSLHGLPVLPRRIDDERLDPGQFVPPKDYRVLNDEKVEAAQSNEAIYRPKPLRVTELSLSSLGGSFTTDTTFEPPAGLKKSGQTDSNITFAVERWRQSTVFGRDVAVEVVYKGFLFPLGQRCSLVKLTERVFLENPYGHYPTAYLTQRMFLRVSDPVKVFPALNQPDGGRRWPIRRLEILTRQTPDIVDPTAEATGEPGRIRSNGRLIEAPRAETESTGAETHYPLAGMVFWPRTGSCAGQEVRFRIELDGSASQIELPLIFVDNRAAHDEGTIAALVRHYNNLTGSDTDEESWPARLVRLDHGGISRRYAEEELRQQTSYETISWTIGAEGRPNNGATGENAVFVMDPLMEGADQPPFYPYIKSAKIRVKQLEALSGGTVRPAQVSYIEDYRRVGFPSSTDLGSTSKPQWQANPLEAFLELRQDAPLSFDDAADRSGGIATPNVSIKALTRKKGPIGQGSDAQPKTGLVGTKQHGDYLTRFNQVSPEKLFGNARLLGIIKFSELLKLAATIQLSHPEIKQFIEYTIPEMTEGVRMRIADTLLRVSQRASGLTTKSWTLRQADRELTFKLAEIVPEFVSLLSDFAARAKSVAITIAENPASANSALPGAVNLYNASLRLVSEIERIADDPAAQLKANARNFLGTVKTAALEEIVSGLRQPNALLAPIQANLKYFETRIDGIVLALLGDERASITDAEKMRLAEWRTLLLSLPDIGRLERVKSAADLVPKILSRLHSELGSLSPRAQGADANRSLVLHFMDGERFGSSVRTSFLRLEKYLREEAAARDPEAARLILATADEFGVRAQAQLPLAYVRLISAMRSVYHLAERLTAIGKLKPEIAISEVLSEFRTVLTINLAASTSPLLFGIYDVCQLATSALTALAVAAAPTISSSALVCQIDLKKGAGIVGPAADAPILIACTNLQKQLISAVGRIEALQELKEKVGAGAAGPDKQLAQAIETVREVYSKAISEAIAAIQVVAKGITTSSRAWEDVAKSVGDGALRDLEVWLRASEKVCSDIKGEALYAQLEVLPKSGAEIVGATIDALQIVARAANEIKSSLSELLGTNAAIWEIFVKERLQVELVQVRILIDFLGLSSTLFELFARASIAFEAVDPADSLRHRAIEKARANIKALMEKLPEAVAKTERANAETVLNDFQKKLDAAVSRLRAIFEYQRQELNALVGRLEKIELVALPDEQLRKELSHFRAAVDIEMLIRVPTANLHGVALNLSNELIPNINSALRLAFNMDDVALQVIADAAKILLTPTVETLAKFYGSVRSTRDKVKEIASKKEEGNYIRGMIAFDHVLDVSRDGVELIAAHHQQLEELRHKDLSPDDIRALLEILREKPAPVVLAQQVTKAASQLLQGDIGQFIDLRALRDEIEDSVRSLVPSKFHLNYNYQTRIHVGGEIKEIFDIDRAHPTDVVSPIESAAMVRRFVDAAFQDQTVKPTPANAPDLVVRTSTSIDILNPARPQLRLEGYLRPFHVKLLGNKFDVVTLYFDGAQFRAGSDISSDFKIQIIGTKLGQEVEFLKALEAWLGPKDGTGLYVKLIGRPLGISAGYGFGLPIISIGTVSFSNVSLQAGVVLPFQKGEAQFRIALSSRDSPFLISAAPFGGGGFVALYANSNELLGFEASFEYGGVAAFGFGPLSGIGRLTTGLYIEKHKPRGAVIQGHFFAGGSARIWIFGIGCSLAVRLGQADGGAMCGSAVFTYSFSLGLRDIEFRVTVWRREGKGFSGQQAAFAPAGLTRYAAYNRATLGDAADPRVAAAEAAATSAAEARICAIGARLASNVYARDQHWDRYCAYFDENLDPEE